MKSILIILAMIPFYSLGQENTDDQGMKNKRSAYVKSVDNLSLEGAFELSKYVFESAAHFDQKVSIAILNADGVIILLVRGDHVGPHNTEASRKKAFTALSTKTPSLELMQKAFADSTAQNLNTLSELLLLGGGVPIWQNGEVIGSIGVSGAGGGLNDHNLAKQAVENLGFTINKKIQND